MRTILLYFLQMYYINCKNQHVICDFAIFFSKIISKCYVYYQLGIINKKFMHKYMSSPIEWTKYYEKYVMQQFCIFRMILNIYSWIMRRQCVPKRAGKDKKPGL